ncbi:DNA (cytosine-5-)-methyltransferase [Spiroplasma endosymbiont of Phycita roborella]|uniref:DNA cytosine methyltransferase n=1 Tax=Spiroplasma endosymbiont of Phycita roborella TaxID=3066311 RepID=UPI00313CE7B9
MKLKVATSFSGIGSFEQALKKMDIEHEILFACDNDKYVKETYFANYKINDNQWYDDIYNIDGSKFKNKVDIFVGGSPCQSFSSIGFQKGLEDTRGLLIFEFIRLVNEIKPKVFIFENVKGLLTNNKGQTWKIIEQKFKETGYNIHYKLLNAKDYGIPQSRNRLFVVGFLNETDFKFPKPIELKYKMSDFLEKAFLDEQEISEKAKKYVLNEERMKKKITQVNGEIMLCQVRNQQSNFIGDFVSEGYIKKFILSEKLQNTVLKKGKANPQIAKTILSSSFKYHYASTDNYVNYDTDRIRRLTPKECLRLMGFPDSFKIVVSNTQIYRQSGNSIVVNVFEHLLKEILLSLENSNIDTSIKEKKGNKSWEISL